MEKKNLPPRPRLSVRFIVLVSPPAIGRCPEWPHPPGECAFDNNNGSSRTRGRRALLHENEKAFKGAPATPGGTYYRKSPYRGSQRAVGKNKEIPTLISHCNFHLPIRASYFRAVMCLMGICKSSFPRASQILFLRPLESASRAEEVKLYFQKAFRDYYDNALASREREREREAKRS